MNFRLQLLVFITLITSLITSSSNAQSKDELAIRQLLHTQTIAWNKGNIEGFMKGYLQSDSLMFIGKSGLKYGYNTTLKNYRKSYPDATAMGTLNFDILQVKQLDPTYAFVVGKWHLKRTIGDLEGHFTLLMKKIKMSWVIVADHSS